MLKFQITQYNDYINGQCPVNWTTTTHLYIFYNKLPLNKDKTTKVMTITGKRLNKKIDRLPNVMLNGKHNVNCALLLGINLDENLTFEAYMDKLCKKLSQRIAVLKKIRHCLPL